MSDTGLPKVFLKPGELYVGGSPAVVTTILGSCVSVVMFNHRFHLAAICHAVLPHCDAGVCTARCPESYRYVNCVIPEMARIVRVRGSRRGDIVVKLFGGADMFGENRGARDNSIGRQNIASAEQALHSEGLHIKIASTGGDRGRKILFYTATGEILMKPIQRSAAIVFEQRIQRFRNPNGQNDQGTRR